MKQPRLVCAECFYSGGGIAGEGGGERVVRAVEFKLLLTCVVKLKKTLAGISMGCGSPGSGCQSSEPGPPHRLLGGHYHSIRTF